MQLKSRILALPLAAVLASGALFSSTPAQAAPKSKTYKAGALVLGAAGAYFLSKGKTLEGAAALGGGYLAYRKGEKERKDEKYNDRYGRYDDGRNDNGRNNGGYYGGNQNGGYYGGNANNGGYYGNGSYNGNGGYYGNNGGNNGGAYYNSNADYRYNNNRGNNDRDCRDNNRNDDRRGGNRSWRR